MGVDVPLTERRGTSGADQRLCGRDAECARLDQLVREAASGSRSGVIVIRGEPGAGKSALLRYAERGATGMRILRGGAVESEVTLSYALLHQLLHPVHQRLEQLPPPQALALSGALGLGPGRGEDRFLVAVAALTMLADVASEAGLLVVVDDAQWADPPSLQALLFVARRLEAE